MTDITIRNRLGYDISLDRELIDGIETLTLKPAAHFEAIWCMDPHTPDSTDFFHIFRKNENGEPQPPVLVVFGRKMATRITLALNYGWTLSEKEAEVCRHLAGQSI